MSLSNAQILAGIKIKCEILNVLKDRPEGMRSSAIIQSVRRTLPNTNLTQIEHVLRSMYDDLNIDRTHGRKFIFSLPDGDLPSLQAPEEEDGVCQRTVPAVATIQAPILRTPMQWCVDALMGT